MDIVAFVIDGIKYIATYKDNNLKILKLENNTLQELTTSENEKIIKLLNRKTGHGFQTVDKQAGVRPQPKLCRPTVICGGGYTKPVRCAYRILKDNNIAEDGKQRLDFQFHWGT